MPAKSVIENQRRTSILHEADVVVLGGGTAGAVAAIAAARAGASTVLIERFGTLGGCATIGRCFHVTNRFLDSRGKLVISGLPVEILERAVKAGGTPYPDLKRTLRGKKHAPNHIQVDPEILSLTLLKMVEEAGVKLLLHTDCYDILTEKNAVTGLLIHNKAGRAAVTAKIIVDASGEADVAYLAGVPCVHAYQQQEVPPQNTFGLLVRLGNVDLEQFMDFFLNLPAGQPDPEFETWLERRLGVPLETLRNDSYWSHFLDPQPVGGGVPPGHPGKERFSPDTLEWFRNLWEEDGYFDYINMHFFRDRLRQAVENGDLEINRKVPGFGEVGFNFDGLTGSKWHDGEVLVNAVKPMGEFNAFQSDHITKVEVAARERAFKLLEFLKKYIPGFEAARIIDTGAHTMPRHPRMIRAEYSLTLGDLNEPGGFEDSVFITVPNPASGVAHEVPYGMMVPQKVDNLIVTGKCADGAHIVRSIPSIMAMGQAAGSAAALCARQGVTPRELDVRLLQAEQSRQGVQYKLS